jgi:NTE family protein
MSQVKRPVDGVFEGGGVKGIALVGAAAVIEEAGYAFHNLAGTSAGAVVASLFAAGYTAAEVKAILMKIDFKKFMDTSFVGHIPLVGPEYEVLAHLGVYKGDYFLGLMRDLLGAKGVKTFRDLVIPGEAEERYKYKLQAVASDISRGRMLVLPGAARAYGVEPDDLEVALAVRMSMSIPYFFQPVTPKNTLGQTCYVVDGGLLSNFPVEIFDTPFGTPPDWPTFGFALVSPTADPRDAAVRVEHDVRGPLTMLWAMFNTAMEAHDAYVMEMPDVSSRTIKIDPLGISPINFELTDAQKEALYQSGRAGAEAFLKAWDFEDYKARFRTGRPDVKRRPDLAQPSTASPPA